jgi:hypothetical protein
MSAIFLLGELHGDRRTGWEKGTRNRKKERRSAYEPKLGLLHVV